MHDLDNVLFMSHGYLVVCEASGDIQRPLMHDVTSFVELDNDMYGTTLQQDLSR